MRKIDQQANLVARGLEIIEKLSFVDLLQLINSLEFNNDLPLNHNGYAITCNPFLSITVSSLNAGPPGFFTPLSQSETRFFDTFR